MLPGTGGLTRVVDKRRVRRDRADVFATRSEGVRGKQAVEWRLVDEVVPQAAVGRDGARAGRRGRRPVAPPGRRQGIALPPLQREETERRHHATATSTATFDRAAGLVDDHRAAARRATCPTTVERVHELGADFWPLAMTRELDDLILRLRTNELELGTWVLRTEGDVEDALAFERVIAEHPATTGWSTRSATTSSARSSGSTSPAAA